MLLTNLCLSATSLGIVGERESGTYEQMLASPTTPIEIVLGKLVPYVVISYARAAASRCSCPAWSSASGRAAAGWRCSLVTLPFVLASLAIGVFVSTLARTSAQAVFISVFFILPSFVLSGAMFPYQLMPPGVREVGFLLPLALVPDRPAPHHRARRRPRRGRGAAAGAVRRCSAACCCSSAGA